MKEKFSGKGLKIAVIGAGSTYTPELIEGFIKRKDELPVSSLYLMDINPEKLDIVGGLAKRMLEKNDMKCKATFTTSLKDAVEDADFVISQIRVGGLDSRVKDEKVPLKYGLIGQETTGAGGFFNALRTIPAMLDITGVIEKYSPDAWVINFSNPSGLVAEALLNHTAVKTMGLCNVPVYVKDLIKKNMAIPGSSNIYIEYIGLNHLSWITAIYCDGRNILPEQLNGGYGIAGMKNITKVEMHEDLLKSIGCLPASSYLSYYYNRDKQLKHLLEEEKSRGEVCKDIEHQLLELYKKPELEEKPAILEQRGGAMYSEAAVSLISAIYNDKNEEHTVNVKNNGALDFMADDDVIEVNCRIGKDGALPIPFKNFSNEHIKAMMKVMKTYERYAVKAAIFGDYNEALNALLIHPLIGDFERAKGVLDEMLVAHGEYLPQFSRKYTSTGT